MSQRILHVQYDLDKDSPDFVILVVPYGDFHLVIADSAVLSLDRMQWSCDNHTTNTSEYIMSSKNQGIAMYKITVEVSFVPRLCDLGTGLSRGQTVMCVFREYVIYISWPGGVYQ